MSDPPLAAKRRDLPGAAAWALAAGAAVVAALAFALTHGSPQAFQQALVLIDHDDSRTALGLREIELLRRLLAAVCSAAAAGSLLTIRYRRRITRVLAYLALDGRRVWRELFGCRPCSRSQWAAPIAIFGIGVVLRAVLLSGPMRFDEADTFDYFASRDFFNLLTDYTAPNNHLLHTALVRFSYLAWGPSPAVLRLPAFVAGVAVVPLVYFVARKLFDDRVALLAMGLAAVQPALIAYSANARGYSLIVVFTLLGMLLAGVMAKRRSAAAWLLFVACGVAGMFTVPTMLYPLAGIALWALLAAPPQRRAGVALEISAAAGVIAACTAALYAPAALRTGVEAVVANRYVVPLSWGGWVARVPIVLSAVWDLWTLHVPWLAAAGAALAVIAALREGPARRLLLAFVATTAVLVALQRVAPFARVFLYLAPVAVMLCAAGLAQLWRRLPGEESKAWWTLGLTALLAASFVAGHQYSPSAEEAMARELEPLAQDLARDLPPGEAALATTPHSEPLRYWLLRAGHARDRVVAPAIVSGQLPPLAKWQSLVLIRPSQAARSDRASRPSEWIELSDPMLAEFAPDGTPQVSSHLERIHLLRRPSARRAAGTGDGTGNVDLIGP